MNIPKQAHRAQALQEACLDLTLGLETSILLCSIRQPGGKSNQPVVQWMHLQEWTGSCTDQDLCVNSLKVLGEAIEKATSGL